MKYRVIGEPFNRYRIQYRRFGFWFTFRTVYGDRLDDWRGHILRHIEDRKPQRVVHEEEG